MASSKHSMAGIILSIAIETKTDEGTALAQESYAFVDPGLGKVGIKSYGLIKTTHSLIILFLAIKANIRIIES